MEHLEDRLNVMTPFDLSNVERNTQPFKYVPPWHVDRVWEHTKDSRPRPEHYTVHPHDVGVVVDKTPEAFDVWSFDAQGQILKNGAREPVVTVDTNWAAKYKPYVFVDEAGEIAREVYASLKKNAPLETHEELAKFCGSHEAAKQWWQELGGKVVKHEDVDYVWLMDVDTRAVMHMANQLNALYKKKIFQGMSSVPHAGLVGLYALR